MAKIMAIRTKIMAQVLTQVEDIVRVDHNGNRLINPLYWCSSNIYVDGDPIELINRDYMHGLYAHDFNRMVLYTGRQVGKSLFLATQHIMKLCLLSPFRSIYVAPRANQTRDWSNDKMKPILENSPSLRYLVPSNTRLHSWRVYDKDLTNGSQWKGRSAYLSADAARGISGDMLCFDKRAYLLTDKGWKRVYEVTKSDLVATKNENGIIEYQNPTKIFKYMNKGEMVRFKHAGFDMRVTPNHKMHVNYKVKTSPRYHTPDKWENVEAIDLLNTDRMGFKMGCGHLVEQSYTDNINIPGFKKTIRGADGNELKIDSPPLSLPRIPFSRIVGTFMSEGFVTSRKYRNGDIRSKETHFVINIKDIPQLEADIIECDLSYRINNKKETGQAKDVCINNNTLGHYFGVMTGAYNKRIPDEFFSMPDVLPELLKCTMYDACYHKDERWDNGTLRTRSRQLAEDVQRAWTIIGRSSVIHTRMMSNCCQLNPVPGKAYKKVPLYEVCAYNRNYKIFWKSEFENKERVVLEKGDREEVYCIEVPNHVIMAKGDFGVSPCWVSQSIDEMQDMLADNVPVLQECLSYKKESESGGHQKKYFLYSGTPKTSSHTLEAYWNISDKREWVVICRGIGGCGTGNILGYDNIGKDGLVCASCGKRIHAANGRWVITNPGAKWVGFRIPQIMTPWTPIKDPDGGEDILYKMKDYTIQRFLNECLAISYDEGTKPISAAELYGCCDEQMEMITSPCEETVNRQIFAGIDWGSGSGEFPSYTVLALGAWIHPQQFQIFYIKKFEGLESEIKSQPEKIIAMLKAFGVRLVTTDWGYGVYQNRLIQEVFGNQRVMELQYVSAKEKLKYNAAAQRMMGDRTQLMQDLFRDIQLQRIKFFKKAQFETFGQDFLNIYTDYNEKRQTIKYDHSPTQPDDCAHAVNYCLIAGKYHHNQLRR